MIEKLFRQLLEWAAGHHDEGRYSPIGIWFHWTMAAMVFFVHRLARAVFSPRLPSWRLVPVEAKPARVQQAAIALDIPLLLQRPHPAKAGRRGNPDPFGQFNIGDSAVGLDLAENLEVDFVQMLRHARPGP